MWINLNKFFFLLIIKLFLNQAVTFNQTKNKKNLTIGFLTSFKTGVSKIISGAVPLAVEYINNNETLLPNHTLKFIVGDTKEPYSYHAIKVMTSMKDAGVIAFIGPGETCAAEALVAAAWNLTMITYKCADRNVSNKKLYPTFVRTLPPSSKISKSLISLLKKFNWYKLVLVVNNNPTDRQIEEAFLDLAHSNKIKVTKIYYLDFTYYSSNVSYIEKIIDETHKINRIYVLLTESHAVSHMANTLYKKLPDIFHEYLIIGVEDEEFYNPLKINQYLNHLFNYEDNNHTTNKNANKAFRAVLFLTPSPPTNPYYSEFCKMVTNKTREEPFNIPSHHLIVPNVPLYAGLLYDAIIIFATALTKVLEEGYSEQDGIRVVQHLLNYSYESILGFTYRLDSNGDAEGNYTLLALKNRTKFYSFEKHNPILPKQSMFPVGTFKKVPDSDIPQLFLEKKINWIADAPPRVEPICGFENENCVFKSKYLFYIVLMIFSFILFSTLTFAYRHYKYEHKLACKLWKVDYREVIVLDLTSKKTLQEVRKAISDFKKESKNQYDFNILFYNKLLTNKNGIGFYKGNIVFISKVNKKTVDLTRNVCKELIQLHEMRNENINPFIGISIEPNNIYILTMYCSRGSLEDILSNENLSMDNVFIASLVSDLIKGLIYLHDTQFKTHGNLKSSNCLVDSRWVLQITGFGLDELRLGVDFQNNEVRTRKRALLWKSPEVLRQISIDVNENICFNSNIILKTSSLNLKKKADIYSLGIILYEIIGRKGPWGDLINQRELFTEHSFFQNINLLKKKILIKPEYSSDEELFIHRSFSDSFGDNLEFNNKNNIHFKDNNNAEVSSVCLGAEFIKNNETETIHPKKNFTNYLKMKKKKKILNKSSIYKKNLIDSFISSEKNFDEKKNFKKINFKVKLSIEEVLDRVRNPSKYSNHIIRPDISSLENCPQYLANCMKLCWNERPELRPDVKQVNNMLRPMQSGLKTNIFDNMILIMESYACNLEVLVEERTKQLVEEKKKTENLLFRMLPKSVAEQLKKGQQVKAETFDCVTIYFSDIVGFTEMAAVSTPLQVVNLLNDLYTCFDSIIGNYKVYKIETIGDAYMVVSGLNFDKNIFENDYKHSAEIALMALQILKEIQFFKIKHLLNEKIKLRIGIHSGPVVAGVVGLKMPRYCLFGDTVNTANRMESTGKALKIHISESCKQNLDKAGGFLIEKRGLTFIKGKGNMMTYWLLDYLNPKTFKINLSDDKKSI